MSNYSDDFKGTNMDATEGNSLCREFESVTVSNCDECGVEAPLNEFGLCKPCDAHAEAFARAAAAAMKRGHNPFKAGMIAAAELERKNNG